jgi:hypothetical protein
MTGNVCACARSPEEVFFGLSFLRAAINISKYFF